MQSSLLDAQFASTSGPTTEVPSPGMTTVFIQDACLQHRYIRSKDLSNIVERPERLRAVNIGLSAAIARLESVVTSQLQSRNPKAETSSADDLVDAINNLKIEHTHTPSLAPPLASPVTVVQSQATIDLMDHPATKYVHGDIEKDVYLENLRDWIAASVDKISKGESEVPEGLSQGDLYLCPGTLDAVQGAIGTVCESVDHVILSSRLGQHDAANHAFVAIRPPGHHCGEDTPSGFCFLNNVAVGAAHAHLQHGINRVVIFDIDLHHGNGTQSIIWQINEETYRQSLETDAGAPPAKRGLQAFYGSLHDILSYPCEDGKPNLVQAASVSIQKAHGQYIENIHLQTYTSEIHFWDVLYKNIYSKLFTRAEEFLNDTGGAGDDVLIFISCGMDACEHEYESMSRHNRKVPASFYHRFARDAAAFAHKYSKGRLISVLEGGYSDRALTSGAMAHLCGLSNVPIGLIDETWWSVDNLAKLEGATKKKRGGRPSVTSFEPWLERTLAIFAPFEASAAQVLGNASRSPVPVPPSTMMLRDRSKGKATSASTTATPLESPSSSRIKPTSRVKPKPTSQPAGTSNSTSSKEDPLTSNTEKKLPRVILRLGKPPEEMQHQGANP